MKLADDKRKHLWGMAATLLFGLLALYFQFGDALDRRILDRQFEMLREYYPQPVKNDVVIVGIDENTFKAFREPFALWHPHLGKFLQAMAKAEPAEVGIDIVLPERSYQFLVPQYDQSLLQGLLALKQKSPVVLAQTLDDNGQFRKIFPPYISVAGPDSLGSVMLCLDPDGVARRFGMEQCAANASVPALAQRMAGHIGITQQLHGLVDYSVGADFGYIPFTQVLEWYDANDEASLKRAFGGKPVLLGVILPFSDRLAMPAALAAWEPMNHRLPGVLYHAQVLRSAMAHGLVQPVPQWLLSLFAAATALFWFGKGWIKAGLFALFLPGVLLLSLFELWRGLYLPVGAVLIVAAFAYLLRLGYEAVLQMQERRRLKHSFGSYVSPQIMKEIMNGHIRPGLGGTRCNICTLFADIRNFTPRSEHASPEEVISLLNDYFSEMTAVIHKHGGTVDKFIGDGLMAFFGAPQSLASPEKNALEASQEMLLRLHYVNRELQAKGVEPIAIGIGLHSGEAVVGNVGSETRNEYTAIGDVVNVASRLEGLTKTVGYPIVCSDVVAGAVGNVGGLVDLGAQQIKGHTAVAVFGWKPQILERAGA